MDRRLQETTTEADRDQGFRNFLITASDEDRQSLVSIVAHRAENVAIYDEAPQFMTLPGSVEENQRLAALLLHLASALLANPYAPLGAEDAPSDAYSITPSLHSPPPPCHEG